MADTPKVTTFTSAETFMMSIKAEPPQTLGDVICDAHQPQVGERFVFECVKVAENGEAFFRLRLVDDTPNRR